MDILTNCLLSGVLFLLIAVSLAVSVLKRYVDYGVDPAVLDTFRTRVRAWWILFGSLVCVFMVGPLATTLLFFILSLCVLREYITLTPKSPVDHQTLFWIYIFFTPLQFILVGVNPVWFQSWTGFAPYQIFSILLPGYVFFVLPGFMATSGDPKLFLERIAKLQLGLIVCVYALSYVPALLTIDLPSSTVPEEPIVAAGMDHGLEGKAIEILTAPDTPITTSPHQSSDHQESPNPDSESQVASNTVAQDEAKPVRPGFLPTMSGKHIRLLFFFVFIIQLSDVFQYLWSQISRRHVVAPKINATRTWEGVYGGAVTTALLGVALWYFTPFPKWWQAGLIALVASFMGFAGNMTMSAIKRDRGVSGYGSLIQGHSGILDRIDSLCFAAPVFYYMAWWFSR